MSCPAPLPKYGEIVEKKRKLISGLHPNDGPASLRHLHADRRLRHGRRQRPSLQDGAVGRLLRAVGRLHRAGGEAGEGVLGRALRAGDHCRRGGRASPGRQGCFFGFFLHREFLLLSELFMLFYFYNQYIF